MITHFIPAPKVEKYSHIVLYRDHEDPFTFYYLTSLPRIQVDPINKNPKFSFLVYARAIDKQNTGKDVQGGRLVMVADLHLTEEEETVVKKTVKDFVRGLTNDDIKRYYRNYQGTVHGEPSICPIPFVDGKATFNLISSDVDGKFITEYKPNLYGNCATTFAANFKAIESQLLYKILKPNEKSGKIANMAATINYEMKYKSILPFRAHAEINYQTIYDGFREITQKHKGVDANYYGPVTIDINGKPVDCMAHGVNLYMSEESLGHYLRSKLGQENVLKIEIDDKTGDAKNAEYEKLLIQMFEKRLVDDVRNKLFEKAELLNPKGKGTEHDVNTKQTSKESPDNKENEREKAGVYNVYYHPKDDVRIEGSNKFNFTISKDQITETYCYPNGSLEVMLDKQYVDSLVTEVNASDIYYQKMTIPIRVDAANFEKDILQISVKVKYEADKTKREETFTFDAKNTDTQFFEVVMERDKDGKLIDDFTYRTKITYRGYDVYGHGRGDNYSEPKRQAGFNEPITITYVDIHNLNVQCRAGDVAWNIIDKLDVEFKYKDAPEKKGATKLMTLTQNAPADAWNCYMYCGNGNYTYRLHYFYNDGTDDWSELRESAATELVVNDKLSGVFKTKFDIDFNKSVSRLRVKVECQGVEYESNWFTEPDTWTWEIRLKEDQDKGYRYMYEYYLVNDDSKKKSNWTSYKPMNATSNQQTESITVGMKNISLTIDAETLDWNKWASVYLHFRYDDDANNLHYDDASLKPLKINSSNCLQTVVLAVMDIKVRPKVFAQYRATSGEIIQSDEITVTDSIIFLPNSVPPKE